MQSHAISCNLMQAQRGSAQSDKGCLSIPRKGWYKLEILTFILAKALVLEPGQSGAIRNSQVAIRSRAPPPRAQVIRGHQINQMAISCHPMQSPREDRRCEHLHTWRVGAQLLDERLEGLGLRDGLTLR